MRSATSAWSALRRLPNFRRRDDDKFIEMIGVSIAIECFGKFAGKPFLGNVMPIGLFHGASGSANACTGSPRTVRTLLARRRIVTLQNFLNDKLETLCVASVAQEKRFLTVADEDESIVGNVRCGFHGHSCSRPVASIDNAGAITRFP